MGLLHHFRSAAAADSGAWLARARALCIAALVVMFAVPVRPALALDSINVTPNVPAIALNRGLQYLPDDNGMVSLSAAPGADGIVRRMEVRARETGTHPYWMAFALTNSSDEQVDRLLVVPHYRMMRSGLRSPDLGARRVLALTANQGFPPERQSGVDQDVFLITLDPGTTVTFVAELNTPKVPQATLWKPDTFKERENAFTLYRGIVIGVAGLLALFLTILFVVKGSVMFPAAALIAWAVFGYITLDFGFWTRVFDLTADGARFYRAAGEAILSGTLIVFLFAYLNLSRWHVRYAHVTAVWVAFLAALLLVGWIDPSIAAIVSRLSLLLVAVLGMALILLLSFRGFDRAIQIAPTWLLLVMWVGTAALVVGGRLTSELAPSALLGALVIIVMLIGFTVMQHAFSGGGLAQGLVSDTERKALAMTGSGDIIFDWDLVSDRVWVSPDIDAVIGVARGSLNGPMAGFLAFVHPADRDALGTTLDALMDQRRGRVSLDFRMRAGDAPYVWLQLRARPVLGSDGEVIRCVGTLSDITQYRITQERLLHDAVHDNLTGLPNRQLFLDRLDAALRLSQSDDKLRPTLVIVDIDRFKQVNESVGLAAGDSILLTLSRRIGRLLKPQDTVARLSADTFGIVLVSERQADRITQFADTIRKTVRAPIVFNDREIFLTASVGLSLVDAKGKTANDLVKDAELAARFAKRFGGDRIEVFKPAMRAVHTDKLGVESDLRRALERGELTVVYQPIMRLEDRMIAGFEALVRWNHPRRGLLPPGEFIPLAEETGLIVDIGLFVMDRAARQLSDWQRDLKTPRPLFVSVNVSSRQLLRHDLLQDIKGVMSRAPLLRGTLKLELTESLVMENPEYAAQMLERIKMLGAGLSLDDFGTGHSSLAYLQRFPFDTIKIDQSFVRPDPGGRRPALLRGIVALSHDLGMEVVAEGAESESDIIELYQLGCQYAQGYVLGEPMAAREATQLVLDYLRSHAA